MEKFFIVSVALLCIASLATAGPKGTVPKTSASAYPVHAEDGGVAVGARVLTSEQARKIFVSDVNRCCTVIEVAIYPSTSSGVEVSLNDFVLRIKDSETAQKPSSAKVLASDLQKRAAKDRQVTVSPGVGVGYGSGGNGNAAGNRGGGVYQQVGVGVGVGDSRSGATDKDRAAMETELAEKGLPEGQASAAVAGYVYFPIKRKGASYQLECTLNGKKLTLTIP